jgi:hypothetical protein
VGKLLKTVDDLGNANNTIVIYTTDNGPNRFTWPDAANSPFRNEKDSNWEGAFRVPAMVRWPGKIQPGQITTEADPIGPRAASNIAVPCALAGRSLVELKLIGRDVRPLVPSRPSYCGGHG